MVHSPCWWCALPDFDFLVFGTTSHCILHQSNVVAPLDISNPVIMGCDLFCNLEFVINEVPEFDLPVNSSWDKSLGWQVEHTSFLWRISYLSREMFMTEHGRLSGRAPTDCINTSVMSRISGLAPRVIAFPLNVMNSTIGRSGQKDKAILPWRPGDGSDWSCSLEFINDIPALRLDLLPYLDLLVIATCSKEVLVLGVSPLDLPCRANVTKSYNADY